MISPWRSGGFKSEGSRIAVRRTGDVGGSGLVARPIALVALIVVVLSAVACDPGAQTEQEGLPSTTVAVLGDGEWELRIDRTYNYRPGSGRLPSDHFTEADFDPLSEGPTYRVVVSEQSSRVVIRGEFVGDDVVEGHRTVSGSQSEYALDGGLGGRLVIWPAEGGLQAELALYGSGLAFLRCVRGALVELH
jgi:hypothetical protein